jgi:hypothetical protein
MNEAPMLRKTVLRLNYLLLARRAMALEGCSPGLFPHLDPGQAYRPRLGWSPLLTKFDRVGCANRQPRAPGKTDSEGSGAGKGMEVVRAPLLVAPALVCFLSRRAARVVAKRGGPSRRTSTVPVRGAPRLRLACRPDPMTASRKKCAEERRRPSPTPTGFVRRPRRASSTSRARAAPTQGTAARGSWRFTQQTPV